MNGSRSDTARAVTPGPVSPAAIDACLPQTQCTRCGEPDCASYARAVAAGAPINRCPPGGADGIARLATLTGRAVLPLDPACGSEGPRSVAWIEEAVCIGCTLCIKACPVDCIIGAPKRMHSVVTEDCTGCELCIPVCPVDCIRLEVATPGRSGWQAWSPGQALRARNAYEARNQRRRRAADAEAQRLAAHAIAQPAPAPVASQAAAAPAQVHDAVQAALARARARRAG